MHRFWINGFFVMVITAAALCRSAWAGTLPAGELLRLLDHADKEYANVHDYTSIMVSRERVRDALLPEERILLKFQRTFKVYMRWMDGPGKGREGLYVAGAHDGKFLVYEPNGLQRLFTAALEPTDARVMDKSRHPVTDVGIGRLLEIVGDNARRAARNGVLRVVDRGMGDTAGRRVRQVECFPPRDPQAGYYGYRVQLFFDEQHGRLTLVSSRERQGVHDVPADGILECLEMAFFHRYCFDEAKPPKLQRNSRAVRGPRRGCRPFGTGAAISPRDAQIGSSAGGG